MKEDNKILRIVYTFFLGLLIVLFVGMGTSTFYTSPEAPKYPNELTAYDTKQTETQLAIQKEYEAKSQAHSDTLRDYNRNVSIITLAAAILLLAGSMLLEKRKLSVIDDGVMLGGLLTLVYSLGRGIASQDSKYSFVAISVGLVVVVYLGYRRFAEEHAPTPKRKRKK